MQTNSNFLLSNPDELKQISFADLEFFVEHFNSKRTRENPNIALGLHSLSDMTTMDYDTTGKPAITLDELYDTSGLNMYSWGDSPEDWAQISSTWGTTSELIPEAFFKTSDIEKRDKLRKDATSVGGYYKPDGKDHQREVLVKDEKGNIKEQIIKDYFPKIGMTPLEDLIDEDEGSLSTNKLAQERLMLDYLGYVVPSKERMSFIRKNLLERRDEIFRHEVGHHTEKMIENYMKYQLDFFNEKRIAKTFDVSPDKQIQLDKIMEERQQDYMFFNDSLESTKGTAYYNTTLPWEKSSRGLSHAYLHAQDAYYSETLPSWSTNFDCNHCKQVTKDYITPERKEDFKGYLNKLVGDTESFEHFLGKLDPNLVKYHDIISRYSKEILRSRSMKLKGSDKPFLEGKEPAPLGFNQGGLTNNQTGLINRLYDNPDADFFTGQTPVNRAMGAAKIALESVPVVGESIVANEIKDSYRNSDWIGVGVGAVALGLGLIPVFGDAASIAIRNINKKLNKLVPEEEITNNVFSGELNLVHGFKDQGPEKFDPESGMFKMPDEYKNKPKQFVKREDYQGSRYDDDGGFFGSEGVYLEDPDNLYFNEPIVLSDDGKKSIVHDFAKSVPRTVHAKTNFKNAFVLTPKSVLKLEEITGIDLKATAKVDSGTPPVSKAGGEITKKLKELGYDGLIIKDFPEPKVYLNDDDVKNILFNAKNMTESQKKVTLANIEKAEQLEIQDQINMGINSGLTQPQIIHLEPENLEVIRELPNKFIDKSLEVNPDYYKAIEEIPKNPKYNKGGLTTDEQTQQAFKPVTSAPFEEGQFDQYKEVDPETYADLKFKQTEFQPLRNSPQQITGIDSMDFFDSKLTPEERAKGFGQLTVESIPGVSEAITIAEINQELQSSDPNWYLIGALAGAGVIGVIPGIGDVAATAIKKGAREVFDVAKKTTSAISNKSQEIFEDVKEFAIGPDFLRTTGPVGVGPMQGTAADFKNFNKKFIGSGQGSQVFSFGHYFTSIENIAKWYRNTEVLKKFGKDAFKTKGGKDFDKILSDLDSKLVNDKDWKSLSLEDKEKWIAANALELKDGYGYIKAPNINALEERLAAWNYPIKNQSKEVQNAFNKTFNDLNMIFDEMVVLYPNNKKEINKLKNTLLFPSAEGINRLESVKLYANIIGKTDIGRRGTSAFSSEEVGSLITNWKNKIKDLSKTGKDKSELQRIIDSMSGDIQNNSSVKFKKYFKDVLFQKGFLEKLLAKNGLHGIKFRPGQIHGGVDRKDRDKLNYVIYNDSLLRDVKNIDLD